MEALSQPCHECGSTEKVSYGPDPYMADVHSDLTPVWLCEDCHWASAQEI